MATDAEDVAQTEAPALSEIEQVAAEMGWKPKDVYDGPEGRWKPARDYVVAEKDISRRLKDTVRDLRGTVEKLGTVHSRQTARALDEQAREINERFVAAVEAKDTRAAADAAKEMRKLESDASAPVVDYEKDFASRNPWYGAGGDDDATAYAITIANREANRNRTPEQQLEAAEAAVKKRFPELFEDAPPARKAPVSAPSPGGSRAPGTGYADLPREAKAVCDRYADEYAKRIGAKFDVEKHRKQYAADFFSA